MSDFLGGLSGLMKGLTGFMPQDDPDVKVMTAQSKIGDLKKQETELYAQIGKQALARGSGQFPELENKLRLVQENLAAAEEELKSAKQEKDAKDAAQRVQEAKRTCPECGFRNPDDSRFCQECGHKLGATQCHQCGAELAPGTRFCGTCGAKQEV
ncbi:MAG TPA: zinc-ribbon domain-containing protein [Firmicutes bacterium]|jgi:ribosomal protein L40E|nr:zinc-ribbon domain-containing protein [Bacillota bacterium]